MTGYDETLALCSHCQKAMLVAHYGFHPAFSVLCPECTAKSIDKQRTVTQESQS